MSLYCTVVRAHTLHCVSFLKVTETHFMALCVINTANMLDVLGKNVYFFSYEVQCALYLLLFNLP